MLDNVNEMNGVETSVFVKNHSHCWGITALLLEVISLIYQKSKGTEKCNVVSLFLTWRIWQSSNDYKDQSVYLDKVLERRREGNRKLKFSDIDRCSKPLDLKISFYFFFNLQEWQLELSSCTNSYQNVLPLPSPRAFFYLLLFRCLHIKNSLYAIWLILSSFP